MSDPAEETEDGVRVVTLPPLPDGAVIDTVAVVVNYVDPETGDLAYCMRLTGGDRPLSHWLGVLEMAKQDLMLDARFPDDEEP